MNRVTLAALLILLGGYRLAGGADSDIRNGGPDAGPTASFDHMDSDQDGRISELEARNAKITRSGFDRLDTDRDGRVSFAEWEAAQRPRGAAGAKGADRPSPVWSPERPDLPSR